MEKLELAVSSKFKMTNLRDFMNYYQKKIELNIIDEKVVIDSIFKLAKLPVTAELLHETGLYNTLHMLSLKGGNIGAKALPMFNKWKVLMTVAMRDRDSPIKSPDQPRGEERSRSTPASASNHASRSSADSNASHCSRDTNSGRSMKYSDPSLFGRRELYDSDRDARCSGSSADFNGLGNRDSYHLYEDGSDNPHLSIDNSEKTSNPDEATDQNGGPKSRILEPYAIEMREGMFRVVKVKSPNNSIPSSVLRARQLHQKELLKKSLQKSAPYKKERDKSEGSKSRNSEGSSPVKHERSPGKNASQVSQQQNNGDRSKRKAESSSNGSVERNSSSADKVSKPKMSSEAKHSAFTDRKRLERKSTPDSTSDKLKKPVKEERSSHVSKSSNADNVQANCDRKPVKIMDSPDNSAMKFITSKKERRAVYSGKKSVVQVPTLQEFCIRVLKKNVDSVKYTRAVPYYVLKPLLEHLSPMQLYKLEEHNRYLLKETDELWKQHCNRDYRGQVPSKNENWRAIYYRAHKEQDRKLKTITANISASSMKIRPDRQTKITLVDSPHDPQRKRMKRSNSPVMPPSSNSPLSSKSSPQVSLKASPSVGSKSSPSVSSKSSGSPSVSLKPESSKSSSKESKSHHSKQPKKADAPLMSKLKKSMGLAYRSK